MADNDQGAALQQAMQQIDTLHHTLTQTVTNWNELFADHPAPAAADHGAQLNEAVSHIHDAAKTMSDELGQKFAQAVESMHQATQQAIANIQQHLTDWNGADEAATQATTQLEQILEQSAAGATNTLHELQSGVEQGLQSMNDLLHNVEQSAQKFESDLVDTVTNDLKKAASEFHDGVASGLTGKLTEHLTDIFNNGKSALDNLENTWTHLTTDFGHEIESAMTSFAGGLEDGIKSQLEAAGEKLVKDAMEMLATFVTTAITETTAGAAVTSAMSPILPEVIIVKEASEAIKDLISVFKAVASVF